MAPAAAPEPTGRRPRLLAALLGLLVFLAAYTAAALMRFDHELRQLHEDIYLELEPGKGATVRLAGLRRPMQIWQPITLREAGRFVVPAVLVAEDRRFYSHWGVDPLGIGRALLRNVQAGGIAQGGSTITQQVVKNVLFPVGGNPFIRKTTEILLAPVIEWRHGKGWILETYLNIVYFGHEAGLAVRGIGAAAHVYFNKPPAQLAPAEATLLAQMIPAPARFAPDRHRDTARARRNHLLERMHEQGVIGRQALAAALRQPVEVRSVPAAQLHFGQYFAQAVRWELERPEGVTP
jgi:membrane peptidoglycan carboxypeptidase